MIRYLEEKKLFQLDTTNTTYVIGLTQEGYVGHVYYGDRLFLMLWNRNRRNGIE